MPRRRLMDRVLDAIPYDDLRVAALRVVTELETDDSEVRQRIGEG